MEMRRYTARRIRRRVRGRTQARLQAKLQQFSRRNPRNYTRVLPKRLHEPPAELVPPVRDVPQPGHLHGCPSRTPRKTSVEYTGEDIAKYVEKHV
jgi:hypothetical protein